MYSGRDVQDIKDRIRDVLNRRYIPSLAGRSNGQGVQRNEDSQKVQVSAMKTKFKPGKRRTGRK